MQLRKRQKVSYTAETHVSETSSVTSDTSHSVASVVVPEVVEDLLPKATVPKAPKKTWQVKRREEREKNHPELVTIWDTLDVAHDVGVAPTPDQLSVSLLPFQQKGLYWMKQQEKSMFQGGILADEMGMGKTISILALMLSDPGLTLIICPSVAAKQWISEIDSKTSSILPLLYHGPKRRTLLQNQYNTIITSYNTIEADYRRQVSGFVRKGNKCYEDSPLHAMYFHRIIMDEAHAFKDRTTSTAKSIFSLQGTFKWTLTGTPLQNRVGDLYGYIRVLKADPFSYYFCSKCPCKELVWPCINTTKCRICGHGYMVHFGFWNTMILRPIQEKGLDTAEGQEAFERLRQLLNQVMLRRTKIENQDDLKLPPKNVIIRRDHFNPMELEFYESLYRETKRTFDHFVSENTVLNHYASIFQLISRLRLAANHPDLVTRNTNIKEMCGVCFDVPEDAIKAKCTHLFCRACIIDYMGEGERTKCPTCHVRLSINLEQEAVPIDQVQIQKWSSSTKLEALIEELLLSRNRDHNTKSIVFSQFTNFLDLCQWRLHKGGFQCAKLYGSMSLEKRSAAIDTFNTNPNVNIFLISLKAGGVALNLVEANQVFLMDPWWNAAVEHQAMDRVHRLGQRRPLKIVRMIIQDSIESRIIELQEKKKAMASMCMGNQTHTTLAREDFEFLFTL